MLMAWTWFHWIMACYEQETLVMLLFSWRFSLCFSSQEFATLAVFWKKYSVLSCLIITIKSILFTFHVHTKQPWLIIKYLILQPINNADFIVPVEIDGTVHQVYVLKRPHVDEFLKRMGELYECVLFTASLAKYADPVADLLDQWGVFRARLFRESCVYYRGNYVKDLNKLGRDLQQIVIVDNSPASYIFHPDNAVSILL